MPHSRAGDNTATASADARLKMYIAGQWRHGAAYEPTVLLDEQPSTRDMTEERLVLFNL